MIGSVLMVLHGQTTGVRVFMFTTLLSGPQAFKLHAWHHHGHRKPQSNALSKPG